MDKIRLTSYAFACGLHEKLGKNSPVFILDEYLVKDIALAQMHDILCEMLADYSNTTELYLDVPNRMDEMVRTYKNPMQKFNQERLTSYLDGTKKEFLKREVSVHHCYSCDARWYDSDALHSNPRIYLTKLNKSCDDSFPGSRKICPKCKETSRIFTRSSWANAIPPWVNIDTFSVYSDGIPKRLPDPKVKHSIWDDDSDDE